MGEEVLSEEDDGGDCSVSSGKDVGEGEEGGWGD